jgi:hypothetical protein
MVIRRSGPQGWLSPLVHLGGNWVSRIGIVLINASIVFWLFLLPSTLRAAPVHPYLGILEYLTIPGVFFLGLALVPLGIWLRWRKERSQGAPPGSFDAVAMNRGELRRLAIFVGIVTMVNLILGTAFSYQGITYMDSVNFCGRTCHAVMQPEYTGHQNSPHARVECVACHIGPGASWFVQSKLSGVGQVIAVTFNTYPRPIPTPVHNLRPARETCEVCHWPQKFAADRLRVLNNYAEDEANTRTTTVLLMRIGGGRAGGPGIHTAHLGTGVTISYNPADETRQTIPRVEYHNSTTGRDTVYVASDAKPEALKKLVTREMDCVDCHNRPTHTLEMPDRAINNAIAAGVIPASLPFVKKEGLALLRKPYKSHDEAAAAIPAGLEAFYKTSNPQVTATRRADIDRTARALVAIYQRNVFPAMNITWGTYPNNVGHMDFPGCFRCHDGSHSSADGKAINNDCNTCHQMLAMDEANPKILSDLGLADGVATAAK